MKNLDNIDFQAGHVLLVDKPLHWTSFDVVNKLRYKIKHKLGVKKIKVGHAGTLDPLATGLLIICTGAFTKRIDEFQDQTKEYTGTFTLGSTTPSFDLETEIDETFPIDHITPELMEAVRLAMIGDIQQYPPVFSAIKVDGKPMYKSARAGQEVEIKPRAVTIHEFELTTVALPLVHFRITCSKGTYIRSMAQDFGKALQSGAHLSELRRTKSGDFSTENAWTVDEFIEAMDSSPNPS
jgi:tRNA pseudouridine55 synthase